MAHTEIHTRFVSGATDLSTGPVALALRKLTRRVSASPTRYRKRLSVPTCPLPPSSMVRLGPRQWLGYHCSGKHCRNLFRSGIYARKLFEIRVLLNIIEYFTETFDEGQCVITPATFYVQIHRIYVFIINSSRLSHSGANSWCNSSLCACTISFFASH